MKPEVFTTSFQSKPQEAAEVPVLTTDATRACSAVHRPLQPIDLGRGELAQLIVVPMDHRCRNLKWILFFQSILGIYVFEQYLVWRQHQVIQVQRWHWKRGMFPDAKRAHVFARANLQIGPSVNFAQRERAAGSFREVGPWEFLQPFKSKAFPLHSSSHPQETDASHPMLFSKLLLSSPKKNTSKHNINSQFIISVPTKSFTRRLTIWNSLAQLCESPDCCTPRGFPRFSSPITDLLVPPWCLRANPRRTVQHQKPLYKKLKKEKQRNHQSSLKILKSEI